MLMPADDTGEVADVDADVGAGGGTRRVLERTICSWDSFWAWRAASKDCRRLPIVSNSMVDILRAPCIYLNIYLCVYIMWCFQLFIIVAALFKPFCCFCVSSFRRTLLRFFTHTHRHTRTLALALAGGFLLLWLLLLF